MKYQLEITTLLVPVNVHQLFEKCEWPELNKKSPMIRGCPKENFQAKLRTDGLFACVHGMWIPVCTCM